MGPQDILRLLRVRPFRPFRISLSDGSKYEVLHPELAIVEPSVVTVGIPGPGGMEQPVERTVQIALLHINKMEPIETKNGRSRKGKS